MSRALSMWVGAIAIALAAYVTVQSMGPRRGPLAQIVADAGADAGETLDAGSPSGSDGGSMFVSDLKPTGAFATDAGGWVQMPDGTPVPPLPEKAPKMVRCGVVLLTYAGAQNAPASARTKDAARELAVRLAADAKSDFHGAVARGDNGSADDIGKIPRGVLEPLPEYVLFTLPPGGVSDPIETPRGYWILKRIE